MLNLIKSSGFLSRDFKQFSPVVYNCIFAFMLCSGLSLPFLNMWLVIDFVSPMRLLWVGFLCTFLAVTSLNNLKISGCSFLLVAWMLWHVVNPIAADGSIGAAISRCFQVFVILAVIFATHQSKFSLQKFCLYISPKFSLFFGMLFILFLVAKFFYHELFYFLNRSVIGSTSNFSIFCAQFMALYLFKYFFEHSDKGSVSWSSICRLALLILPFLCWQILSSGRTGFVLMLLIFGAFGFSRSGFRGAFIGALTYVLSVLCIEFFLGALESLVAIFTSVDIATVRPFQADAGEIGMFRFKTIGDRISFLDIENFSGFGSILIALDNLLSMRITLFFNTLDVIDGQMLLFGYGLENMRVWNGFQFLHPHVELLRHLVELGLVGAFLAVAIYLYPVIKKPRSPIEVFSLLYLVSFLVSTLAQSSGPLSHLNNAVLFWMVYARVTMVDKK